jgi:uncharacterized protein with PIN domain
LKTPHFAHYGVTFKIINRYLVVSAPDFGITLTKPFSDVFCEKDIGSLYLEMLKKIEADVIPIDPDLVDAATQAWLTFGKGRHPAGLNFAGCLSYALAKRADEPLLFVGDDFSRTDIEAA